MTSIFDIECPEEPGFNDHPACVHWKFDKGEWYCELYPDIWEEATEEVNMPWE